MGGTLRNRSAHQAQGHQARDAQHETTWRKSRSVSHLEQYVAHVPFPAFFVVGAMFGVLFAMAVIIAFRVPKDLVIVAPATPVQTTVVTTHAKILFVWRPQLTVDRAPSSSSTETEVAAAAAPSASASAVAVTTSTTRAMSPRTYRVASIRRPSAGLPANLLSAGL